MARPGITQYEAVSSQGVTWMKRKVERDWFLAPEVRASRTEVVGSLAGQTQQTKGGPSQLTPGCQASNQCCSVDISYHLLCSSF